MQVEAAGQAIETELQRVFGPLSRVAMSRDLARMRPSVMFDKDNNAIWLKLVRNSKVWQLLHACFLNLCILSRLLACGYGMSALCLPQGTTGSPIQVAMHYFLDSLQDI